MTIEHITGSYPPNGKAIKHDRPMIPREVLEILKRPQVEMISIVYDHGAGPRFDLYKKERDSVKWIYETLRIETNGTREPFDKLLNAEIKSRAGAEVVSFILEESYRGRLYRDFLIRIPVPTEEGSHEPGD